MLINTYFARQPIFDRRNRVSAYELLYRSGPVDTAEFPDGVTATARVLANAFSSADPSDLLLGLPAFVNLPRALIVSRAIMAIPPERVAVEVLEDVTPDAEVIAALVDLRAAGYRIALDDYTANDPRELLLPYADIVKVDLMATDSYDLGPLSASLRETGTSLLAEKVESAEEHDRCMSLGYTLFQGFYFAKPELVSGRRVDEGRSRLIGLLGELHRTGVTIDQVTEAVERHPDFVHQLLKVLNSVAMSLSRHIDTVREAVVMLGIRRVTEMATLLVLASSSHKPRELLTVGLTRARMCATAADRMGREDRDSFFTVGVLSILDAMLDQPMHAVVDNLPLSEDVKAALVDQTGVKGELLRAAIAYERADWDSLAAPGLDASSLAMGYVEALEWSNQMMAIV